MKEISVYELPNNPFKMIGKDWMLITAKKGDRVNTMTASWGGVGILWNKPVAYIFIRSSRFTKGFVDEGSELSLCMLPEQFREQLTYFGRHSGRDEDKIATAGLEIAYEGEVPYFSDSDTVFICRKLYAQEMKAECFCVDGLAESNYADGDFHTTYVVEIEKVLKKD
ncbi:MAG: flavin reductase [Clostridia bacterium]|nr:flavin reductase [Clostridia bacterium]